MRATTQGDKGGCLLVHNQLTKISRCTVYTFCISICGSCGKFAMQHMIAMQLH